jgi:nitrite reductase/ring-hydroxylating ferredoxin subunit
VVRCPWHGWRFDVRTGESLQSDRWKAPTYEVEVEDGEVYVSR